MRVLCLLLVLSQLICQLHAINRDTLKRFFSDQEKHGLRDMHKILSDINSFKFGEYRESIFTVMGMGIDIGAWDQMVEGFVEFNSLSNETGRHMKTLKYNEFQVKDVNNFGTSPEGHSLFLRTIIEKSTDTKLNYIFSGTNVLFKLHPNTPADALSLNTHEKLSLQHYISRRALENLKRKESTFISHMTQ